MIILFARVLDRSAKFLWYLTRTTCNCFKSW